MATANKMQPHIYTDLAWSRINMTENNDLYHCRRRYAIRWTLNSNEIYSNHECNNNGKAAIDRKTLKANLIHVNYERPVLAC